MNAILQSEKRGLSPVFLRLNPADDVVIACRELETGTNLLKENVVCKDRIPAGHKVATRAIAKGEPVRRYSQIIGFATQPIAAGQHVHVHNLEVRDFGELSPFYGQVVKMFSSIFLFIALVMGVIVLFAVINTMTMNVMERTNEVGTIRALGVRRAGIRAQFTVEGVLIGAIGATVGAALALAIAALVNQAGLTWVPPGNATAVPLRLDVAGRALLVVSAWLGLAIVTTLAALLPANRAARLPVVDALRHV